VNRSASSPGQPEAKPRKPIPAFVKFFSDCAFHSAGGERAMNAELKQAIKELEAKLAQLKVYL
jgi:hypothetical protein